MAVGTSFKQECPSCEAMVLVKDPTMIGKKIECPTCKDRFIVNKPAPAKTEDEDEEIPAPKAKGPTRKTTLKPVDVDDDDAAPKSKSKLPVKKGPKPNGVKPNGKDEAVTAKLPQKKGKKEVPKIDDEAAAEEGPKKKKKGMAVGSKKLKLGLGLAVVGVLVLGMAGYFIMFSSPSPKANPVVKNVAPVPPPPQPPEPPPPDKETKKKGKDDGKKTDGKNEEKDKKKEEPTGPELPVTPSGPEFTNLLPPDTEQVVRLHGQHLLEADSLFREAIFQPGSFSEAYLKKKLGFSALAIDDMIVAERFTSPAWSMTVVHVMENLSLKELTRALGLEQVKTPIKNQVYYQVKSSPWMDQLAKMAPGVPPTMRQLLARREGRPLYARIYNHQTLILADDQPMQAFLQAEGQFKYYSEREDAKADPKNDPKKEEPKKDSDPLIRGTTFMTIKPALKLMLDRLQPKEEEASRNQLQFVTVTDMAAASVPFKVPEYKQRSLYRPRPLWDVTCILEDQQPRLSLMGTVLVKKDLRKFRYRTEMVGKLDIDARDIVVELTQTALPKAAKFIEQMLDFKIELAAEPMGKGTEGGKPPEAGKPPETTGGSRFTISQVDKTVNLLLDLDLDGNVYVRIADLLGLIMIDAHGELVLTDLGPAARQQLAQAGNRLGVKGLEPVVLPGRFPPGAFPRPNSGAGRDPAQRISWMAGLLPYLGQEKLYRKIHFDSSWRESANWLPGRTLVPQFQDASYPDSARFVFYPDLPMEMAATHFVGIAGVGLDAADYPAGDPSFKRGILGYEHSASLEDVRKGRGLGNTVLMIQVPYDSIVGPTPWIAGGGTTLRGVPDKNSIDPFVLGKDRDGKPTQHNGRAGTYALMADGSVRFISKNVSDDVFKTICTHNGPSPDGFDLDKNDATPLVFPAGGAAPEKKAVEKKAPEVKAPEKKEPEKTKPEITAPEIKPEKKAPAKKPAEKK